PVRVVRSRQPRRTVDEWLPCGTTAPHRQLPLPSRSRPNRLARRRAGCRRTSQLPPPRFLGAAERCPSSPPRGPPATRISVAVGDLRVGPVRRTFSFLRAESQQLCCSFASSLTAQ